MDNEEFDNVLRGRNINFLIGSSVSAPMCSTLNLNKQYILRIKHIKLFNINK